MTWAFDGFEFGGGIVIAGGIDGVEKIVGVESGRGEAGHGGGKKFCRQRRAWGKSSCMCR